MRNLAVADRLALIGCNRFVRSLIGVTLVIAMLGATSALAATINGSGNDDSLTGTSGPDVIKGFDGDDVLDGLDGADSLLGGGDADRLYGRSGADLIEGNDDRDVLDGGDDGDVLRGGDHDDQVSGSGGDDVANGGNGSDVIHGDVGHDTVEGDAGNDQIHGDDGSDQLLPDVGEDRASGGGGNDLVLHGPDKVRAFGGDGSDMLLDSETTLEARGGGGDDVIFAATHSNGGAVIDGGAGIDTCYGISGDTFVGCETQSALPAAGTAPSLTITAGPADGAVLADDSASWSFSAAGAPRIWCLSDTMPAVRCDSGRFDLSALADGSHTIAVVAMPSTRRRAVAVYRRFTVAVPPISLSEMTTPGPDALRLSGQTLSRVDAIQLDTADGQTISRPLPSSTVTRELGPGGQVEALTLHDITLGNEDITQARIYRAGEVAATFAGPVHVASSVSLQGAQSPAPETLVVSGANLSSADQLVLIHDGGRLVIDLRDPDIVIADDTVTISRASLAGLSVTQIDAELVLDGAEILDSVVVAISIIHSDTVAPVISTPSVVVVEATGPDGGLSGISCKCVT